MGFSNLIRKAFKGIAIIIFLIFAVYAGLYIYTFLETVFTIFPRMHSIPANDAIWTSKEYVEYFGSREKWRMVESFYREEAVYYDEILPELVKDPEAFSAKALGLYWNVMSDNLTANTLSNERIPIMGETTTDTAKVRNVIVALEPSKITLLENIMVDNETAYRGGFEVFEIQWYPAAGAMLKISYIFHHALPPKWESLQWYTLYVQHIGRHARLRNLITHLVKKRESRKTTDGDLLLEEGDILDVDVVDAVDHVDVKKIKSVSSLVTNSTWDDPVMATVNSTHHEL